MKNIYEDAGGQRGSKFPQNMGGEKPQDVQANPPQASSQPVLQLSNEQIAAILAQLVASQPNLVQNQPQIQTQTPEQNTAETPSNDDNPANPGKRILFQSEDFEAAADKNDVLAIDTSESEKTRRSFYDDDDLFDDEYISRSGLNVARSNPSAVKTTDFGSDFSISEVELPESELPNLPATRLVGSKGTKPAARSQKSAASKAAKAPEGSIYDLDVEEISLGESMSATEKKADENSKKKKKLSKGEIVRRVILSVSLLAIVIASGVLVREYVLHKQNEKLEAEISNMIIDEAETETTKKKSKKDKNKKPEKTTAPKETAMTPEQQWKQVKAQYPNVVFPPDMQLKYAKLYATNPDFVGYLSADGVNLNLPIVQADDDEKYLAKNFYGKSTKYGCPFVTHSNNITELDKNTVIFGHHMNDGTVFGALDAYKSIEGFKKAPVITFNTLYKNYKWKIIAAFITNAYEKDDNNFVFQYYFNNLSTEESFAAFLNELAQRSLYDTGVDVQPSDKILTLSTCSHEFEDARFVVIARLVRSGESADVSTDNAVENTNPRYPQAYYTKKKLDNPFANASKWYVE